MAISIGNLIFEGQAKTRDGIFIGPNNDGKSFSLVTGNGDGTGNGGLIELRTGDGGNDGNGGDISIIAGDSGTSSGIGGSILIRSGVSNNSGGGNLQLESGQGVSGGSLIILSGQATSSSGVGGQISIIAGNSGSNANGANIVINAGAGGSAAGSGGDVEILGGNSFNGNGGSVLLLGRNATGTNNNGGNITLQPGLRTGTGVPGRVILSPGLSGSVDLRSYSSSEIVPLRFFEAPTNGSNFVAFRAPTSIASNVTWILPNSDGSNGQVLSTNGSGQLTWANNGILNNSSGESFETVVTFTTTNNTTQTVYTYSPGSNRMTLMETFVTAKQVGSDQGAAYIRRARFRYNNVGAAAIIDLSTEYTSEDVSSWDHTLDVSGTSARVRITGQSSTTINWVIRIKIVTVTT